LQEFFRQQKNTLMREVETKLKPASEGLTGCHRGVFLCFFWGDETKKRLRGEWGRSEKTGTNARGEQEKGVRISGKLAAGSRGKTQGREEEETKRNNTEHRGSHKVTLKVFFFGNQISSWGLDSPGKDGGRVGKRDSRNPPAYPQAREGGDKRAFVEIIKSQGKVD